MRFGSELREGSHTANAKYVIRITYKWQK